MDHHLLVVLRHVPVASLVRIEVGDIIGCIVLLLSLLGPLVMLGLEDRLVEQHGGFLAAPADEAFDVLGARSNHLNVAVKVINYSCYKISATNINVMADH